MTRLPTPVPSGSRCGTARREDRQPVLFISDLHLSPERPLSRQLFLQFAREVVPACASLYILGDFFEAWVGDDDLDAPFNRDIVAALQRLSENGVDVFFLPGNRDFLVGADFARGARLTLLQDPSPLDLHGTPTLLTHGDLFCTGDAAYQAFRKQVRDPAWQAGFLARPVSERRALAQALRERSEEAKADKKTEIMDVSLEEVARYADTFQVSRIIHGHTHRPAFHAHLLGRRVERWVLPDWYEDGGYLYCDRAGCRAVALP